MSLNIRVSMSIIIIRISMQRNGMNIRSSLSLCHQIIKAGQKIDDTHIVHVILLSVPHTGIWDLIKQNHLDKRKGLTLDMVTAELIAIHDRAEWNQVTDKA